MADKTKLPGFIRSGADGLENTSRSVYLTLKDGDSKEVASVGDVESILSFEQHVFWLDEGNSPMFPCLKSRDCPGCMLGGDTRFRAIMLVQAKGEEEQRILALGKDLLRQVIAANEALDGQLKGAVLRISRKGSGMQTKYNAMPTARKAKVGTPELDLLEHIGPIERDEIIELLKVPGLWPPKGLKGKPAVVEEETPVTPTEDAVWDDVEFED